LITKISLLAKQSLLSLRRDHQTHGAEDRTVPRDLCREPSPEQDHQVTDQDSASTINFNEQVIEEFRANAGKVGGPFEGASLVLLTTIGAKTGTPRTNPVMFLPDGDRILVIASNAGAPTHPAWYRNLLASPEITVEIGEGTEVETYTATAVPMQGEERDRLFARVVEVVPGFAEYQANTSRVIPVVAVYRKAVA
jgi:deazaflavin-dependent oxidoreductase (nitroreductase family)